MKKSYYTDNIDPFDPNDKFHGLYNVQVEQAVLGCLFLENGKIFEITELQAEDFFFDVHQDMFDTIRKLIMEGKPANPVTLKTTFGGDPRLDDYDGHGEDKVKVMNGAKYMMYLSKNALKILDFREYAHVIRDLSQRRKILVLMEEARARLYNTSGVGKDCSIEAIGSDVGSSFIDLTANTSSIRLQKFSEVTSEIVKELSESPKCIPTGMKTLDQALCGGFLPKKSYCFAAPPKHGKTMMMSSIFVNVVKQNFPAVYIAAEMGAKELHQRNVGRAVGAGASAFYTAREDVRFIERVMDYRKAENMPGYYADVAGCTFDQLKMITYNGVRNFGARVIFVDYIGLIEGNTDRFKGEAQWLHEVCKWVAQAAKKLDITIVYAAQINREGLIRGSDGPIMNADWVAELRRVKDRTGSKTAWLKMHAARNVEAFDIGRPKSPSLRMHRNGPHFKDINDEYDNQLDRAWVPDDEGIESEEQHSDEEEVESPF